MTGVCFEILGTNNYVAENQILIFFKAEAIALHYKVPIICM